MIYDKKAKLLEEKGLWRRAANRWGEVLMLAESDKAREYIAERRSSCIRKASVPLPPQKEGICAIRDAATKTLKNMGIDSRKTDPLRLSFRDGAMRKKSLP